MCAETRRPQSRGLEQAMVAGGELQAAEQHVQRHRERGNRASEAGRGLAAGLLWVQKEDPGVFLKVASVRI